MFLVLKTSCSTGYTNFDTPFSVRNNIMDLVKGLVKIDGYLINKFFSIIK